VRRGRSGLTVPWLDGAGRGPSSRPEVTPEHFACRCLTGRIGAHCSAVEKTQPSLSVSDRCRSCRVAAGLLARAGGPVLGYMARRAPGVSDSTADTGPQTPGQPDCRRLIGVLGYARVAGFRRTIVETQLCGGVKARTCRVVRRKIGGTASEGG
jgi:hypothetical protein